MIVLPATRFDVELLCREMRESDRGEAEYCAIASGRWHSHWTPDDDLRAAYDRSPMWAVWLGGALVGIGGVAPLPHSGDGVIWFFGTELADAHILALTFKMRRFMRMEARNFSTFVNLLPQHMVRRRRWLEKLGFDFGEGEAQQIHNGLVAFRSQSIDGPDEPPRGPR